MSDAKFFRIVASTFGAGFLGAGFGDLFGNAPLGGIIVGMIGCFIAVHNTRGL